MFRTVKKYVRIIIVSHASLSSYSATRMAVISASSTDAESLINICSSWSITVAGSRVPLLEPSVSCCRMIANGCILVISISVHSRVQYIIHSYGM